MLPGLQEQRHFPGEKISHGIEDLRRPVDGAKGKKEGGNARPEDEISATRAGSKKTDLQRDQKDGKPKAG
jgi:hypothetical protein